LKPFCITGNYDSNLFYSGNCSILSISHFLSKPLLMWYNKPVPVILQGMMQMKKNSLNIRCCKNCIKGIHVGIRNEILCREKGIVSPNYSCSRFMAFELDTLQKHLGYRCCDCIHFTFSPDSRNSNYGVCSMFSVRQVDGSEKKACSKFKKKGQRTA